MKKVLVVLIAALAVLVVRNVFAVPPPPYKTICHHTPGNNVTLDFANVQSYNGHLGTPHSGSTFDTDGPCTDNGTTPTNTLTPTPTDTLDEDKVLWCHCEPNGNCQTLNLPQQALEQAGHVNASGNPLHAGDHPGACSEITPTPTGEITPTSTPSATLTPGGGTGGGGGGGGGHVSDGLTPRGGQPAPAAALAPTGTFTENLMNTLLAAGIAFLALGAEYASKKAKLF